jgi:hypothetical protein
MMQSEKSEFGFEDGNEHTSRSVPKSSLMQHVACASAVRQSEFEGPHCVCAGSPENGSVAEPPAHVELHGVTTPLGHFDGRESSGHE